MIAYALVILASKAIAPPPSYHGMDACIRAGRAHAARHPGSTGWVCVSVRAER